MGSDTASTGASEKNWLVMAEYLGAYAKLSRALLSRTARDVTRSETEMLIHLYLFPTENTAAQIAQRKGLKKEAVSRSVKGLVERGYLRREIKEDDERAHCLYLTEKGYEGLKAGCDAAFKPLYELARAMGDDFFTMSDLVKKAAETYCSSM